MKRVVIIVERGFQDQEFCYAYDRSLEAGFTVDVATPLIWRKDGEEHTGRRTQVLGAFGVPAKITKATDDLRVKNYDAVIIPGGFISPDILRMRPEVLSFVSSMFHEGKLVAMQCHGVWVGVSTGILRGKTCTSYVSLNDDVINAGGLWRNDRVVVDGNLITAQHYRDNAAFMKAVVEYLQ